MKKTCNKDYFEKIDSEAKAYFLGLLYADGCICLHSKRQSTMQIMLQEKDRDILRKFQKELKSNHQQSLAKGENINQQDRYGFRISSDKLCSDLIKLGCIPRKSLILEWPTNKQVPKKFLRHFVRGYFDGDGSIYSSVNKGYINPQLRGEFCGTYIVCESINKLFNQELGISYKKLRKYRKTFRYRFEGNKVVKKIYHYLYDNATIFLSRKKNRMQYVLNIPPYKRLNF